MKGHASATNTTTSGLTISDSLLARVAPGLVLVLCLVLSALAWQLATDYSERASRTYFDFRVREALDRIDHRMQAYEQVLRGAQGLYKASVSVQRTEFRDYVAALKLADDYPGIQGVGLSLVVPAAAKAQHVAELRQQGFADYDIQPPGLRDSYTSIIYLEPFTERNQRAFGYDMSSEPVRRAALEAARDTNAAALSGKVRLLQESGQSEQAGFLMYLPIYRNGTPHQTLADRRANLFAWVYAPFRMDDLMRGILGEHASDLDIEVFDGPQASPATLMYDSEPNHVFGQMSGTHEPVGHTLNIAGHHWTVQVSALTAMTARTNSTLPLQVGLAGGGATVLLTWVTWLLASGRQRALRAARNMNTTLIKAESGLLLQTHRFQEIIWGTGIATWEWVVKSGALETNARCSEMLGYTPDELAPISILTFKRLLHPDDLERANELLARCLSGETKSYECEARHRHKDGHWIWGLDRARVVEWSIDGSALRMSGTRQDISVRKQIEKELVDSNWFARATIDAASAHICVLDLTGKILAVNQAWRHFYDANESRELVANYHVGTNYLQICRTATGQWSVEAESVASGILQVIRGECEEFTIEYPCHSPTEQRWFHLRATRFQGDSGNVVLAHENVTERKQVEDKLKESEERLRMLFDSSPDAYLTMEIDKAVITDCNHAAEILLRCERAQILGKTPDQFSPLHQPDGRLSSDAVAALINESLQMGSHSFEWMHQRLDGSEFWAGVSVSVAKMGQHQVLLVGWRDITDRKQIQQALAESEERFRHFFEKNTSVMLLIEPISGEIVAANHSALTYYGYALEPLVGSPIGLLNTMAPETIAHERQLALREERNYFNFQHRLANGEVRDVEVYSTPVNQGGTSLLFSIIHDVTLQKAVQIEVKRSNTLLESILSSVPVGLSAFDDDLNLIAKNDLFQTTMELPDSLVDPKTSTLEKIYRFNASRGEYGDSDVDAESMIVQWLDRARYPQPHHFERVRPNGVVLDIRGTPMPNGGFVTTYSDVTERKRMEDSLREKERILHAAIEALDEAFVLYDPQDRLVLCNEKYKALYASQSDLIVPGASFEHILHTGAEAGIYPDAVGRVDVYVAERMALHQSGNASIVQKLSRGRRVRIVERRTEDGYTVGFRVDITALMKATEAAEAANRQVQNLLEAATEVAIIATDNEGLIQVFNRGAERLLGYEAQEMVGKHSPAVIHLPPELDQRAQELILELGRNVAGFEVFTAIATQQGQEHREWTYVRKDGSHLLVSLVVTAVRSEDATITGYLGIAQDITERRHAEERIQHMAQHDVLTDLPNRALLYDRLSQECAQARRNSKGVALMFIDLDGFKGVNDTFGHEAGDAVLIEVARRWQSCVRASDTVARIGGDEFAVVMGLLEREQDAHAIACKLIKATELPIVLPSGGSCTVGTSVGISLFPTDAMEIDTLLALADAALYESKHRGKNTLTFSNAITNAGATAVPWMNFTSNEELGIAIMDEQHRHLVNLLNHINTALHSPLLEVSVNALFQELVEYTTIHFDTEHDLMQRHGYQECQHHNREHAQLLQEVKMLVSRQDGAHLITLQTLKDWLLWHIHLSDQKLANYLLSRGVR